MISGEIIRLILETKIEDDPLLKPLWIYTPSGVNNDTLIEWFCI